MVVGEIPLNRNGGQVIRHGSITEDIVSTTERFFSSEILLSYYESSSRVKSSVLVLRTSMKIMNALGANDSRRIPIRQRTLHPSMLSFLDLAESSSSDPGQSLSLSPYCDMDSMYFDNSLYENEMHYKIANYLDEYPLEDDFEEIKINANNEREYNEILNSLVRSTQGKFQLYGIPNNPMEIVIEEDPRKNYRVFDEKFLMNSEED